MLCSIAHQNLKDSNLSHRVKSTRVVPVVHIRNKLFHQNKNKPKQFLQIYFHYFFLTRSSYCILVWKYIFFFSGKTLYNSKKKLQSCSCCYVEIMLSQPDVTTCSYYHKISLLLLWVLVPLNSWSSSSYASSFFLVLSKVKLYLGKMKNKFKQFKN